MPYLHILVQLRDGIGRLTLNRPLERNAMTLDMGKEIQAAVAELNAAPDVRVVIVTGAGEAFSAGGNLRTLAREVGLGEEGPAMGGGVAFYSSFLSIRDLAMPSIAAINGHAVGAGLCFALGCDLRVAHESAKLGMTFVKLGIHPGMGATWSLPRLVGPAVAADLLYTGRMVPAREAMDLGLINRVAGADFSSQVERLAEEIASNGPVALRSLKETLRGSAGRTLEQAIEREASAQAGTFATDDAREGVRAITEKRPPRFRGR
jgi:enoyl-CoA hydratase